MDDPERDKFYSPPEHGDDDEELELEPPDESIDEHQKKMVLQASKARIDIDEVYRDADRDYGGEILENWVRNFRFRFQVKHLLIATAVLAIVMTLVKLQLFWTTLIVGIMLSVSGFYIYLRWEEQKLQAAADRKREALYARRRAHLAANMAGLPVADLDDELLDDVPQPPNAVDEMWQDSVKKEPFRIQFSVRQLLILMTVAAVTLGMIRFMGGASAVSSVLGLVALGGLVVYAMGFEPPQNMVLGWWLILVLYVVVSILTAMWGVFA